MQETCVQSLDQDEPLEKEKATHSSILPGESHGQRSLAGYSPQSVKESDTTEQLSTHVALIICHILNPFSPHNICKIDAILIPVLQMRKLRQKEGM